MTAYPTPEPANADGRVMLPVRAPQDLALARRTVIETAARCGLDDNRAARLALAVTEIAANALVHADGAALLEILTEPGRVTVEVSDHGPGVRADRNVERPAPDQDHGRGLWLAGQLCDRVDVLPATDGTRIALTMHH